jgi:class 3 adenylate cyclase
MRDPVQPSGSQRAPCPPASTARLDLSKLRHDLRTPINHILGYCEMLQEDEHTPASFQADLRKIHTGGRQLLALMTEYFDEEIFEAKRHDLHQLCHELRTPVNHIIGYGELLQDEAAALGGAKLLPDLKQITGAARTWLALMEKYLVTPAAEAVQAGASPTAPLSQGAGFTPPTALGAGAAAKPGGHLLVVDDDAANREMLARRLAHDGWTVSVARSGLEALQAARARQFDLILLDMVMPGLDGCQVLRELKSAPALAEVPVVMISASDQEESIARCLELGAEDYVAKPFNPILLRARIGACLEKKRLRDREVSYVRQLQEEKQRSEDLLRIILPVDVADELKATHSVQPRRFESVGVLFCDLVGFTPYCDQHPPEEILDQLQRVVEAFETLAATHGLEKIKTVGDAFMATAGLRSSLPNPAWNCVRCAGDMIAAARRLPPRWQVRAGLHVGPVVAGVVGRRKYQYDVWGDTVNVAARMQEAAQAGSICVSAQTWRLLEGQCPAIPLGPVDIKGKGRLELFRIEAVAAAAAGGPGGDEMNLHIS